MPRGRPRGRGRGRGRRGFNDRAESQRYRRRMEHAKEYRRKRRESDPAYRKRQNERAKEYRRKKIESDPTYRRRELDRQKASRLLQCNKDLLTHECRMKEKISRNRSRSKTQIETKQLFKCSDCDRVFSWKASLRRHGKLHAGQKSIACKICNEKFAVELCLHRHLICRSDERFSCNICEDTFSTSHLLREHLFNHISQTDISGLYCV
ncbi:zinc finger protein 845-like isoform X2 [Centruroides sculpturatus]|uniref:zinc finger protein 845-like isoform X2 n=1 Tax=Centruroides sculpturatus TaxID=218467 RepID=UPI000C6DBD29|nr:zinc finger protein 845-like isoform X2 [Centruroides sculpturatus]